jgi:hypothetical protein
VEYKATFFAFCWYMIDQSGSKGERLMLCNRQIL